MSQLKEIRRIIKEELKECPDISKMNKTQLLEYAKSKEIEVDMKEIEKEEKKEKKNKKTKKAKTIRKEYEDIVEEDYYCGKVSKMIKDNIEKIKKKYNALPEGESTEKTILASRLHDAIILSKIFEGKCDYEYPETIPTDELFKLMKKYPITGSGIETEKKPKESYPESVNKAKKILAYDPKNISIFGSYSYRSHKYPGDIDLIEKITICCTKKKAIEEIVMGMIRIVKNILTEPGYYFSEMKAGIDKTYEIDIGEMKNGKVVGYEQEKVVNNIKSLYSKSKLSKKEYEIAITSAKEKIKAEEYDKIYNILRNRRILRWTAQEVINGYKKMSSGGLITLGEAIGMNTPLKIDAWIPIECKYVEVTNFFVVTYKDKEGKENFINFDPEHYYKPEIGISEIIRKMANDKVNYKPFKLAKRMWSLSRMIGYKEGIKRLMELLNSDAAIVYQIHSELEVIINMLSKLYKPPMEMLMEQLNSMKMKLSYDIEMEVDDKLFNKTIDEITKGKYGIRETIEKLKELDGYLYDKVNKYSKKFMAKNKLIPVPKKLLIKRKENKTKGGDLKDIFMKLANAYRKRFCKGKARPLFKGEIHPLCSNFSGPGTRIELPEVRNYEPYGPIDACSKQHDIDYENALKPKNAGNREKMLREADKIVLNCYDKHKEDEPYYSLAKAGIGSKVLAEDMLPELIGRYITGSYYGKK